jgi:hypothetical protein
LAERAAKYTRSQTEWKKGAFCFLDKPERPLDDPGEPCYESETIDLLKEIKEKAEQGDLAWLSTTGKVYAAVDAA